MHIKTNIEHSSVQIIILAICPLLLVINSVYDALFYMAGTVLCLIVSQIFILIFNKFLANNVKAMLTAIISALIVTISMILVKDLTDKVMPEMSYFMIFSTTILNAEFIYFRNKATSKYYFFNVLKIILIFAVIGFVYSLIKELMAFGTLFDYQLLKFEGFEFCRSMIFNLLILALLCAFFDYIVRLIDKVYETKNMVYQKYVKIIRNEKAFQYDKLRRERLLTNEIEVNRLSRVDAEKLKQKLSENVSIDSVQEAVTESDEIIVEPTEVDEVTSNEPADNEESDKSKQKPNKRTKKSKKGGK